MATDVTSPVGRMVWGGFKPRPKLDDNRQPVLKDGKPVMQVSFGLAISKADFNAIIWPVMYAEAVRFYPSGTFPPGFAFKYVDGDTIDSKGKPFNQREGYAGNIVLAISTYVDLPPVMAFQNGAWVQIPIDQMKSGYYFRVNLGIDAHGKRPNKPTDKEGLYLNPKLIQFIGYGVEIFNAPDPEAAFGNQPVALPPGASATPLAPSAPPPGMAPAAPAPGNAPPPPFAAPAAAPPPAPPASIPPAPAAAPPPPPTAFPSNPPAAPPPPNYGFVSNVAGNPPAAPGNPPPPPPAPTAPPAKPEYQIATGQPIPTGYVFVRYTPDNAFMVVVAA